MLLKRRCTVCGDSVHTGELVECEMCGREMHEPCVEFETKYECERCSDEVWVGALEF